MSDSFLALRTQNWIQKKHSKSETWMQNDTTLQSYRRTCHRRQCYELFLPSLPSLWSNTIPLYKQYQLQPSWQYSTQKMNINMSVLTLRRTSTWNFVWEFLIKVFSQEMKFSNELRRTSGLVKLNTLQIATTLSCSLNVSNSALYKNEQKNFHEISFLWNVCRKE
jgi:hypothetical protein